MPQSKQRILKTSTIPKFYGHSAASVPLATWPDGRLTKSLAEVATMLCVHKNTVQRWIKSGRLACTRFGRNSIHFTFEQVQTFVDGCEHQVKVNFPGRAEGGK